MDISSELKELRVDKLPQACWPPSEKVNDLATRAAQSVKSGITHPYIFVKLAEWLPHWARESREVAGDGTRH